MEQASEQNDELHKVIRSDSDPQLFEGTGEEVEILFHIQDQERMPPGIPRKFIVSTHPKNPEFNQFIEQGDNLMHPVVLFHKKDKAISPENFFEPDAIQANRRIKAIAIGAGIVAAAGGLTLLIIKSRKK